MSSFHLEQEGSTTSYTCTLVRRKHWNARQTQLASCYTVPDVNEKQMLSIVATVLVDYVCGVKRWLWTRAQRGPMHITFLKCLQ